MQLFEIKNDLAKIIYAPAENHLLLADFILIEDVNQSIIAQVINIESTDVDEMNVASVKFSLSISKTANLSTYNGYTPAKDANILYIDSKEIAQLIQSSNTNLYWGSLAAHPETEINLGLSLLREKPYIQCDKRDNSQIITTNILYGLQSKREKTIVIDFDGRYQNIENSNKITVSKEYKLPLNFKAFDFISDNDLTDCTTENKAIIQGILLELQSYVDTLEEKFIPFDIFKSVIDEQCRHNPIPELLIFKNKLIKYQQKGLFAQSSDQFDFLNKILSKTNITVIDASAIDEKWHKFIIETIAAQITTQTYFIVNLNNDNSDKSTLKSLYDNENLRVIPVSEYKYNLLPNLKALCKNLILFAPIEQTNDFEIYNTFLHKLNQKEFIIWSENTFFMPLILKLKTLNNESFGENVSKEIKSDVDKMLSSDSETKETITVPQTTEIVKPEKINEPILESVSQTDKQDDIITVTSQEDEITDEDLDFLDNTDTQNMGKVLNDDDDFLLFDEPVELAVPAQQNTLEESLSEERTITNNDDIPVIVNEDELEIEDISDIDDEQIIAETPKSQIMPEPEITQQPVLENQPQKPAVQPQTLPQQPQPAPQVQQTSASNSVTQQTVSAQKKPGIPVYEAKIPQKDTPDTHLNEGNFVYHAKYGKGIVEKIITYGNKTLCSIQFDNVGRRLLDPNLADIQLV